MRVNIFVSRFIVKYQKFCKFAVHFNRARSYTVSSCSLPLWNKLQRLQNVDIQTMDLDMER